MRAASPSLQHQLADVANALTPRARGMEQIDKNGWSAVERIANVL
jgi:hypothetical protein